MAWLAMANNRNERRRTEQIEWIAGTKQRTRPHLAVPVLLCLVLGYSLLPCSSALAFCVFSFFCNNKQIFEADSASELSFASKSAKE